MALWADYPDRQFWTLQVLTDLEVAICLEESKEADLWLFVDALYDEVISHIFISVEHIAWGLANEYDVDKLLWSIAMLCEKRVLLHVHVTQYVSESSSQDNRID